MTYFNGELNLMVGVGGTGSTNSQKERLSVVHYIPTLSYINSLQLSIIDNLKGDKNE